VKLAVGLGWECGFQERVLIDLKRGDAKGARPRAELERRLTALGLLAFISRTREFVGAEHELSAIERADVPDTKRWVSGLLAFGDRLGAYYDSPEIALRTVRVLVGHPPIIGLCVASSCGAARAPDTVKGRRMSIFMNTSRPSCRTRRVPTRFAGQALRPPHASPSLHQELLREHLVAQNIRRDANHAHELGFQRFDHKLHRAGITRDTLELKDLLGLEVVGEQ
jgi:hypothetical protein